MIEKVVTVVNRAGIHARPASVIVERTKNFSSSIHFELNGNEINAKSILGIITLGAAFDSQITIRAEGGDEKEAVEDLARLFASKFEEE